MTPTAAARRSVMVQGARQNVPPARRVTPQVLASCGGAIPDASSHATAFPTSTVCRAPLSADADRFAGGHAACGGAQVRRAARVVDGRPGNEARRG